MVQEFHVLRCFSCHTFQVHQVKKSRKWLCKLCGEKQSVIKVYGQGSAADCRCHVQKLNLLQGEVEHTANATAGLSWQNEVSEKESAQSSLSQPHTETPLSCWSKYMEKDAESSCVTGEEEVEEDSLIYTDPEHFYIQKNITSERRKRTKMHQNAHDFEEHLNRATVYTSKKKRASEKWTASTKQTDNPYYITNDMTCTGGHEKTILSATTRPTCSGSKWESYISTEEEVKENISRIHIFQKQAASVEPKLNAFQHNLDTAPPLWFAPQEKTSLESDSHRSVHEKSLLPGQCKEGNHVSKSSIFQSDEDFDENY